MPMGLGVPGLSAEIEERVWCFKALLGCTGTFTCRNGVLVHIGQAYPPSLSEKPLTKHTAWVSFHIEGAADPVALRLIAPYRVKTNGYHFLHVPLADFVEFVMANGGVAEGDEAKFLIELF